MKLHQLVESNSTLASLTDSDLAADLMKQFADTDIQKTANNITSQGYVTRLEASIETGLQINLSNAIKQIGFNVASPTPTGGVDYFPPKGSKSLIQRVNMQPKNGIVIITINSFKVAVDIKHDGGKDGIKA